MATVWTLTLGTSFDLKSGGTSVAKFTTDKATLPGEVETKGNITVKDSGNSAKVTLSSSDGAITSGAITASGAIKGAGITGSSLDVSTGGITCGSINSSGSVSAESGFYVE